MGEKAKKLMGYRPIALRLILTLVLGAAGAAVGVWLDAPLPYLLGPLFVVTPAALMGAPVARPPDWMVTPMRVVLGVMVGASLSPELFGALGALGLSLLAVPIFVVLSTLACFTVYTRVGGYSRPEAYFAALPGGLHSMTAYAEDIGLSIHRIALAQAMRVVLVIACVPIAMWAVGMNLDFGGASHVISMADVTAPQHLTMLAAGAMGYALGRLARIPGGSIIGPMLVSSALHLTGTSDAPASFELIALAQLVLGCAIGARFVGEPLALIRSGFHLAVLSLIASGAITVILAWQVSAVTGIDFLSLALALAPGGMPEMSLVAIALGLDAAFVTILHLVRILLVLLLAPLFWRLVRPREGRSQQ